MEVAHESTELWQPPKYWKWANLGLFFIYFVFSNTHYNIYNKKVREKMSILYMVPGLELTTFETWVSYHNH